MKQKIEKHFLFRIVTRLDLLLFLYIIALTVVYIVGNYKFYIDEVLLFLINTSQYLTSGVLGIISPAMLRAK